MNGYLPHEGILYYPAMPIQDGASMTTESKLEAIILGILEGYSTRLASLRQQVIRDERK